MTHSHATWLLLDFSHENTSNDWFVRSVMTHSYVNWLIYMWHDSVLTGFLHEHSSWLIRTKCNDSFVRQLTHPYVAWLRPDRICYTNTVRDWFVRSAMTHSYVNWLIHMWHDSVLTGFVTRTQFVRDMTHSHVIWLIDWIRFTNTSLVIQIDRKKPPPPGGFPIYYVPSSRTVSKRTPLAAPGTNSSRGVLLLTVLDEGT